MRNFNESTPKTVAIIRNILLVVGIVIFFVLLSRGVSQADEPRYVEGQPHNLQVETIRMLHGEFMAENATTQQHMTVPEENNVDRQQTPPSSPVANRNTVSVAAEQRHRARMIEKGDAIRHEVEQRVRENTLRYRDRGIQLRQEVKMPHAEDFLNQQ